MEWPDYKHFSPTVIQDISAEDTELMAEVVKEFIKCVPNYMAEMDAAVSAQDNAKVKFVAHKLKGSCRFIGAEELASLLQEMETNSEDPKGAQQIPSLHAKVHAVIPPLMEEVNAFSRVLTQ